MARITAEEMSTQEMLIRLEELEKAIEKKTGLILFARAQRKFGNRINKAPTN